jgi:hypothetical protein
MMDLKLPLDFERLPEFWQLEEALREVRAGFRVPGLGSRELLEGEIQQMAVLLWLRLWIVLGYLARTTNRPGWLNAAGVRQMNAAFHQFGEECPPTGVLEKSGLLKGEPRPGNAVAGEFYCDLFMATNAHLAGDYVSKEKRGNLRSALSRGRQEIAQAAMMQAQLLPPEIFRRRDGAAMDQRTVDRCMVLIMTLDRCLQARRRASGLFTQGLLADACAVLEATPAEELTEFYHWLQEHVSHPATPKSAEDILREWHKVFLTAKRGKI